MLKGRYDLAIVGSGFAGSMMAMIARRLGRSVVLIEKGTHPRFAIGESSTPLANLLLEELAQRYDLPRLEPLTKWGSWRRAYPELACGLKRGFSFYHHEWGRGGPEVWDRDEQLLVAASPRDEIADTHWYRPDFDKFFVDEARAAGVDYFDEVELRHFVEDASGVEVSGERRGEPVRFAAKFLVDATGPRGFLHRALGLQEMPFPDYPETEALYTHFTGVGIFGGGDEFRSAPYPVDDAALHHVFDGGWMWVLRFNNGLTSAGVAVTASRARQLRLGEGAPVWCRLLDSLPAVKEQFANANAALPFVYQPRIAFRSGQVAGARWAMLPSAAAFVDPLLSTGFPLTLLGVGRMAEILEGDADGEELSAGLKRYAFQTCQEAAAAARLVGGLYASIENFSVFTSLTLLYFAAASFAETARRLHRPQLASSFLLCEHPVFGPACVEFCKRAGAVSQGAESDRFRADVLRAIEPFNVAGLGKAERRNWYPVEAGDLLQTAGKLGVSEVEIQRLLERCGFAPACR